MMFRSVVLVVFFALFSVQTRAAEKSADTTAALLVKTLLPSERMSPTGSDKPWFTYGSLLVPFDLFNGELKGQVSEVRIRKNEGTYLVDVKFKDGSSANFAFPSLKEDVLKTLPNGSKERGEEWAKLNTFETDNLFDALGSVPLELVNRRSVNGTYTQVSFKPATVSSGKVFQATTDQQGTPHASPKRDSRHQYRTH